MSRDVYLIGARSANGIAGNQDGMPWHVPEDLKHFKEVTSGHSIIMGRKTYESIGRPLPHRENIVLTIRGIENTEGITTAASLEEAVQKSSMPGPVFVIGGSRPWEEALEVANCVLLTQIDGDYEGDVSFPDIPPEKWDLESRRSVRATVDGVVGAVEFLVFRRR